MCALPHTPCARYRAHHVCTKKNKNNREKTKVHELPYALESVAHESAMAPKDGVDLARSNVIGLAALLSPTPSTGATTR